MAMGEKIASMRPRGVAVTKMHLNLGTQMELHQALRFADIIGPFADAEGMRELEKKQAAFGTKNKKTSEQKSPGNAHQALAQEPKDRERGRPRGVDGHHLGVHGRAPVPGPNQGAAQHNRQRSYPFTEVNEGNLSGPLEHGQLITIDGHQHAKSGHNTMG